MARYLGYHAGPDGYGLQREGLSVPLATGTYTHLALAGIVQACLDETGGQGRCREETAEAIIAGVAEAYRAEAKQKLFAGTSTGERLVEEQVWLVQALVWGWYRVSLPEMLKGYEVVAIEREFEYEAAPGIVQMTRPDLVLRSRATKGLLLRDFKTASSINAGYVEEYRESVQMAAATKAVEAVLGEPVLMYEVDVLLKGGRRADYNPDSGAYDGPERQQSCLVYGYKRPGNPPLQEESWQPQWRYLGADGKHHTLGRGWSKAPAWERWTPREWVLEQLPYELVAEQFVLIGPYRRQEHLIEQYFRGMVAEEGRWRGRLWDLYHAEQRFGWESQNFQDLLSEVVPRSYACHGRYGASRCQFYDICFRNQGWDDPLGSGKYKPRVPHHEPELRQAEARGVVLEGRPEGMKLGADDETA